ncbi:unnamed protein product [Triticum turgidum subsp. durum]|uniref:Uncharacterized protein n=1 Tax=Triticum turgidum subsp. durum TaxID=4567 RepID=A0A9R1Q8J8_TRITD|nr:unnamed protein product [Triticum turgidum subsp. durum]
MKAGKAGFEGPQEAQHRIRVTQASRTSRRVMMMGGSRRSAPPHPPHRRIRDMGRSWGSKSSVSRLRRTPILVTRWWQWHLAYYILMGGCSEGLGKRGAQWMEVIPWEPRAFVYHNFLFGGLVMQHAKQQQGEGISEMSLLVVMDGCRWWW